MIENERIALAGLLFLIASAFFALSAAHPTVAISVGAMAVLGLGLLALFGRPVRRSRPV